MTSRLPPFFWVACGLALWLAAFSTVRATPMPAAPPAVDPQAAGGSSQPADTLAGEDTCLACHEDKGYKNTLHGKTINDRTPAATQGCESCHGPGKAHADSGDASLIRRFNKASAVESSQACVSCHNRAATHALWEGSQHDQRNIACATCHSVHSPKSEPQLAAKDQTALCSTCHKNVANKTYRFNHMPVREGAMNCGSCHNVHGSTNVRLLKAGYDDRRELHELPCRQARTVPVGARAGQRVLHHLPRPARFQQRPHAREQAAVPLSAVPCHVAPPSDRLRGVPAEQLGGALTECSGGGAPTAISWCTDRIRRRAARFCVRRGR